jgi:hypothetical protein
MRSMMNHYETRIGYLTVKRFKAAWWVFHGKEALERYELKLDALRAARELVGGSR